MSTIYVYQSECPAHVGPVLAADKLLMWNSVSGRTENVTAGLVVDSGRSVTAGTTSSAFAASGITTASTLLAVNTLTDPTAAGSRATIIFPSSTAIQTVAPVAATILGSTVTVTGATKITHTGTSDALSGSITLVARTTAQWVIEALTAGSGITTT
jgi:hypothetical protein